MDTYTDNLNKAAEIAGSFEELGRACKITGKAIKKWAAQGRPPRTEYTGETQYAELISARVDGKVSVEALKPVLNKPSP